MNLLRHCTLLVIAIAGLTSFSGCGKQEPIRIGFIGGLTGRTADLCIAGRNGATLAIDEINAKGGISGRKLELIVRDDEQNPETAKRVFKELNDLKVAAVIGPMTSSIAMAIVPLADEYKLPLLSPTVTTSNLTGKDDHFIRVIATTKEYAIKSAQDAFDRKGARRAAAIYDVGNRAYTEDWINHFEKMFNSLGGQVVTRVTFTSGKEQNFTDLCALLLKEKPDTIIVSSNAIDSAMIVQQLRKLGSKASITMSEWASTERMIELGGQAAEGVRVLQYFDRDDQSARYQSFLKSYREHFKLEPGFAGVAAYDATHILITAFERHKEGETIRDTILRGGSYDGLQERISIDRYGDSQRKTNISEVKQGRFVIIH